MSPALTAGFLTTSVTWLRQFTESVQSLQSLGRARLFAAPWTAACQAFLSITTPGACPNSCPSSQWCQSTISTSVILFSSCLPSIRVSSNESVLHIRWPKYWSFSFSISPSNEYLGFPLGLTGLISFHGLWNNHVYFLRKACYKFLGVFFPKPVFSNFISPGGRECLN